MIAEVSAAMVNQDVISVETDAEMEHEESNEKGKEKHQGNKYFSFDDIGVTQQFNIIVNYKDLNWNSPYLDFQTPPPEQC